MLKVILILMPVVILVNCLPLIAALSRDKDYQHYRYVRSLNPVRVFTGLLPPMPQRRSHGLSYTLTNTPSAILQRGHLQRGGVRSRWSMARHLGCCRSSGNFAKVLQKWDSDVIWNRFALCPHAFVFAVRDRW